MRTAQEIEKEIAALKAIKPTVRRRSAFGDDHHDAIDGQVEVLEGKWTETRVCDHHDGAADDELWYAENVFMAGLDAARWLRGDDDEGPSEGWAELVS